MFSSPIWPRLRGLLTYDRSIGFGLETLGLLTLRFPRAMALVVLAMSILAGSQMPRLNVDGDLLRIYANSGSDYTAYERLANTFGTFENDVYILVSSPHMTDPAVLEKLRQLAFDLELDDHAAGTLSPFTLRKPTKDGDSVPAVPEGMRDPATIAAALTDLQRNDPMMRNLINPDLSGMVMILFPNPDAIRGAGTRSLLDNLNALKARYEGPDIQLEMTGPPIWTSEMLNATVNDQLKFTLYGFTLGSLIALISLRSLWGAVLVAIVPFTAVFWVLGGVMLVFGSFSFLTIIVTTLVLVISFAETLFFVFNWLAYWRDGMDPYKAVDETVKVVGPASSLTMLTTLVSFASLSFTAGQGILEFSIAGTLASLLNFACLMTLLPLLLKLFVRMGVRLPRPSSLFLTGPGKLSWRLAMRFSRPIALAAIAITIMLFVPYSLNRPHFSFEEMMTKNSSAVSAAENIDKGVGGVAPIYIRVPLTQAVDDVSDADFATIRTVHQIFENHLGRNKVISAASFTHYADSGFTRKQIFDAVGPYLKRRFLSEDGREALITGFMPTIIDSAKVRELIDATKADLKAAGITNAEIGGFRVLTTYATDNIVNGLQLDLTMSVLVNLFLIGFAFASLRVAVATAIPNLFPVLGTEAWLYFTGQGLQMTTVLALTIAFGIAVDDTTHFLSHYLHARRFEGMPHRDAIKHTIDRIGGAVVATTIILCSGTGIVLTSDLPQVALFGTLFVVTMGLALIGDVFILPALLYAGDRFFAPLGGLRKQHAHAPAEAPHPEAA